MESAGKPAKPNFGPLVNKGDVLHAERSARFCVDDGIFDVAHIPDQAHFPHVDLLQTGLDKAAAGIRIVVGELLLHLGKTYPIGDEFVGIHAHLIFADGTAEAGDVDKLGYQFKIFSTTQSSMDFSSITS